IHRQGSMGIIGKDMVKNALKVGFRRLRPEDVHCASRVRILASIRSMTSSWGLIFPCSAASIPSCTAAINCFSAETYASKARSMIQDLGRFNGLDHGVGHPLLLLYDVK